MVLVCNAPEAAAEVIDGLKPRNDPASHMRLIRMHGKVTYNRTELMHDPNWIQGVKALNDLAGGTLDFEF
jgi:beta-N-acetylhexosaminidase